MFKTQTANRESRTSPDIASVIDFVVVKKSRSKEIFFSPMNSRIITRKTIALNKKSIKYKNEVYFEFFKSLRSPLSLYSRHHS